MLIHKRSHYSLPFIELDMRVLKTIMQRCLQTYIIQQNSLLSFVYDLTWSTTFLESRAKSML